MAKSKIITIIELTRAVEQCKQETKYALDLIFSNLNHGQTQKLLKNEEVSALVQRYNVQTN